MVGVVGVVAFGLLLRVYRTELSRRRPGDQAPRVQMVTSQPTLSQDFAADSGGSQPQFWPTAIPQAQPYRYRAAADADRQPIAAARPV